MQGTLLRKELAHQTDRTCCKLSITHMPAFQITSLQDHKDVGNNNLWIAGWRVHMLTTGGGYPLGAMQ